MIQQSLASAVLLLSAPDVSESLWHPGADIYHSPGGWLIKLDLAGVLRDDIAIETHGMRLKVSGCRRDLIAGQGWRHHTLEIAYTRFERSFELPCQVEQANTRAEFIEGMLLIYVTPRSEGVPS